MYIFQGNKIKNINGNLIKFKNLYTEKNNFKN